MSNVRDLFFSESPILLKVSSSEKIKQQYEEYRKLLDSCANPTIHALYCYNGKPNHLDEEAIKNINLKYNEDDFFPVIKTLDDINKSLKERVTNRVYNDISYTFRPFNAQNKENRGLLEIHKDNIKAYQFFIKVTDLVGLIEEFLKQRKSFDSLFDLNIRGYLGLGASQVANKAMHRVLYDKDERGNFGVYNNGITIVSSRIEVITKAGLYLKATNPSIINGLQTTMTIYNTAKDHADKEVFSNTEVLVRLYEVTGEELVNNIVISSNTQAKVTLGNKLSNLEFSKNLSQYFDLDMKNRIKYIRKISDIDSEKDCVLPEDALKYWYATYYGKPHKANSRRGNVVSDFYLSFISDSKTPLKDFVNRPNDLFLKEVLCACKIYISLEKQSEHLGLEKRKYLFDMIAYAASYQNDIEKIQTQKISEVILKNALDIVQKSIDSESSQQDERNFIRTDKAITTVNNLLQNNTIKQSLSQTHLC